MKMLGELDGGSSVIISVLLQWRQFFMDKSHKCDILLVQQNIFFLDGLVTLISISHVKTQLSHQIIFDAVVV